MFKFMRLLALFLPFVLFSCSDKEVYEEDTPNKTLKQCSLNDSYGQWKWTTGQTITYKFFSGSVADQKKFENCIKVWAAYANLNFKKVDGNDFDVSVALLPCTNGAAHGSSHVGRECLYFKNSNDAAVKVYVVGASDKDFRRVVLHEWGHVLGLLDEVMNPKCPLTWIESEIVKGYQEIGYSLSDAQDLYDMEYGHAVYYPSEIASYGWDPTSIMMYPIEKNWNEEKQSYGVVYNLSNKDKEVISKLYPFGDKQRLYRIKTSGLTYINSNTVLPNPTYWTYSTTFAQCKTTVSSGNMSVSNECESDCLGLISKTKKSGMYPLYSFRYKLSAPKVSTSFITALEQEFVVSKSGWVSEGILGYVYITSAYNRVPVYRYLHKNTYDHFYATEDDVQKGVVPAQYRYEGIAFYVEK